MTTEIITAVVRHVLTFGGGYLVTSGLIDNGQLELATGAICTIVGVAWSVWQKRQAAKA